MISKLIELAVSNNINIDVSFHKNSFYSVSIYTSNEGTIFRDDHADLFRVVSKAYIALTEFLFEKFGGY